MEPNDILTWEDLHDSIRALSNASLHRITRIANVAIWPVLRMSLYAYAMQCKHYTIHQEDQFYVDFMHDVSIKETITRTIIGPDDRIAYLEVFTEHAPADTLLLYVTQFFKDDVYVGAWFTYQTTNLTLGWICITSAWDVTHFTDVDAFHSWAYSIAHDYTFKVFAVLRDWPRVLVGERHA